MKRSLVLACAALASAVMVAACRQYLPSNRFLTLKRPSQASRSTADARGHFDHDRHAGVLGKHGVTCLDCHRFDAILENADDVQAQAMSAHAVRPGSAACHSCHVDVDTRVAEAPSTCLTCHGNLQPLRPADLEVAWAKVHANVARVDSTGCANCHSQSQCIDCHQRRDSIQTTVHDRNFRFFHGIQARANPMQCGSCHREDFCIRCHERGGVESGR